MFQCIELNKYAICIPRDYLVTLIKINNFIPKSNISLGL